MGDTPLWVHPSGRLSPSLNILSKSTPRPLVHPSAPAPCHPSGTGDSTAHSGVDPPLGYPQTWAVSVPRSFRGLLHQPQHGSLEAFLANLLPEPLDNLNLPILELQEGLEDTADFGLSVGH